MRSLHSPEWTLIFGVAVWSFLTTCCSSSDTESDAADIGASGDVLWRVSIAPGRKRSGGGYTKPVVGSDGTIYVGGLIQGSSGTQGCLVEVSPEGTVGRQLPGSQGAPKIWLTVSGEGTVYAIDGAGGVYVLPTSGEGVFQPNAVGDYEMPRYLTHPFVADSEGTVYAVSGRGLYTISVDSRNNLGMSLVRSFGRGIRGMDDRFSASWSVLRELSGGSQAWQGDYGTPYFESLTLGYDGTLIARERESVVAYSSQLERLWTYRAGYELIGPPRVGHEWSIYAVAHTKLYALTAAGELKWVFDDENRLVHTPLIGENAIYVADSSGQVLGLTPQGELFWRVKVGPGLTPPALGLDGTVYVRCRDGFLYALHPPM